MNCAIHRSRLPRVASSIGLLLLSATAVAQPAATQRATPSESFVGEMLAILIPLALIIAGLLFLLRLVRRRYGLSGDDAPLSVVQILPLGPRERLVLVKSRAGRVFAVGVGAHSVNFVTNLESEDLEPRPQAGSLGAPHSPPISATSVKSK